MYISNPCVTSHDSRPKYIMLYYVLHYLLVSLFVVMNRCGVILWDLILAFFLTTFQLVCMWLSRLPQLRYWSGGGDGKPIAIMRCLFPKHGCTILAALNLIIL